MSARAPAHQPPDHQLELVLRSPPPRRVRVTAVNWMGYGLVSALFFGMSAAMTAWVAPSILERNALQSRGVTTTAHVASVHHADGIATVDYEYVVDGRSYRLTSKTHGIVAKPGAKIDLVYLAEDPSRASFSVTLAEPFWETFAAGFLFAAACFFVTGVCVIASQWRDDRRQRRLLMHGLPVMGVILSVTRKTQATWKVSYFFALDGKTHEATTIAAGSFWANVQPSTPALVLYDPQNVNRSELYTAILGGLEIIEPTPHATT
jgi:hypothetical protein